MNSSSASKYSLLLPKICHAELEPHRLTKSQFDRTASFRCSQQPSKGLFLRHSSAQCTHLLQWWKILEIWMKWVYWGSFPSLQSMDNYIVKWCPFMLRIWLSQIDFHQNTRKFRSLQNNQLFVAQSKSGFYLGTSSSFLQDLLSKRNSQHRSFLDPLQEKLFQVFPSPHLLRFTLPQKLLLL